jgi:hypothetical protein
MFSSAGDWFFDSVLSSTEQRSIAKLLASGCENPSKTFTSRQATMLSTALGVPQEFLKDSFSLINLGKDEIAVLSVEKFCDTLACEFNV